MSNILTVHAAEPGVYRTRPLYRYDYGQILKITGLELPAAYEVHFGNRGSDTSVTAIGDADGVSIPDACLTSGEDIRAWLYLHTGESDGETECTFMIPVMERASITQETPTPVQQDVITQAIAALQAAEETTGRDVTDANAAKQAAEAAQSGAEAWAVGKRGGEDVGSGDPAYHNNAKYYAGQASGSATAAGNAQTAAAEFGGTASTQAQNAEAYAIGKRSGEDVSSSDPTYHNNAKYYAGQASGSATSAGNAQTAAESARDRAETAAEAAETTLAGSVRFDAPQFLTAAQKAQALTNINACATDGYYEELTSGRTEQIISSVYVTDKVPYNFRTSGGSADIGTLLNDEIVGGTVAWNQLVKNGNFASNSQWSGSHGSITISDNVLKYTVTTPNSSARINGNVMGTLLGHYYFVRADIKYNNTLPNMDVFIGSDGYQGATFNKTLFSIGAWTRCEGIFKRASTSGNDYISIFMRTDGNGSMAGDTVDVKNVFCIDLTKMFGSAIADYIYTLESGTAGAGVSWFRKLFPKDYYAYNAGELLSVNTSSHDTVGFNAYDNSTGKAKLLGGRQYQITGAYTALAYTDVSGNAETITPDGSGKFTPTNDGALTVTGGNGTTTCVHLVWDGERDGEYEPYVKHSYALDSSLALYGKAKLDANNKLYYDGDTYESDGTVTRKYAAINLGSLTWTYNIASLGAMTSSGIASVVKGGGNLICARYIQRNIASAASITANDHFVSINKSSNGTAITGSLALGDLIIKDSGYADAAAFKTAMNGVYLVYELATPTTESAAAFSDPQIVDDWGTEEYVDAAYAAGTRDVKIPVGHNTQYQNNLVAKLEMAPESPNGNGDYIVRQTGGVNAYALLEKELPALPTTDGTYDLVCTVTDGVATLSWQARA